MLKRLFLIGLAMLISSAVYAETLKIGIVDVQKIVNNSAQVKALRAEDSAKRKELAAFIKKAGEDIKKETNVDKKKALAQKYEKQLEQKRSANAKAYETKLNAIDKSINTAIAQQAKNLGYDIVLPKGVVLYGGEDITDSISKLVK